MHCEKCERPIVHCECMTAHTMAASTMTLLAVVDGFWPQGQSATGPNTVVYYGFGGEKLNPSSFATITAANEFASFLNSDRIFDCAIPRQFLKETV